MTYALNFLRKAREQLNELDSSLKRRIGKVLDRVCVNPDHFVVRLVGYPDYKVKVGKYRVIVSIDRANKVITVLRVDLRKKVYKKPFL